MHRGVLLAGLVILTMASLAIAQEVIATDSAAAPPVNARPRRPAGAQTADVAPAAHAAMAMDTRLDESPGRARPYVAQHPNPDEPLGFSGGRFSPQPGPVIDPAATPGVFDMPYEPIYDSGDPDAPAPATSSGDWLRDGHWYTEQSVVYLTRTPNVKNDVQLAIEAVNPANPDEVALDVALDAGFQPGLLSTIGRYLGRDIHNRNHSVEFSFLGLIHWQFGESITADIPGTIFQRIQPFALVPVYDFSNFQQFDQTSDFNSYEVNYRIDHRLGRDRMVYTRDSCWVREATPALVCSVYAGVRVVIINERIAWFANSDIGDGSYIVVTHNNMVGPQAGAEMFYERAYWRAGIRAKAGALVNWASQSSTVRILNPDGDPIVPNRDEFAKLHTLGFAGGLSFIGEYRFRPSFGLRVSYELSWVTDLALAQNQITFFPSTPPEISASHSLFFQGVTLGFEWFR